MRRAVLIVAALAATVLPASSAVAEPICVWGYTHEPVPRTVPMTCLPYLLGTQCTEVTLDAKPEVDGQIGACVPAPLVSILTPPES
jgi:hypothetical protein